jgi:mono/diheme cytochrome c family protein
LLAPSQTESPQRSATIAMLAAMVIRSAQDEPVQRVLALVADDSLMAWQRTAVLRGAEVALVGAQLPGTPARRGGGPSAASTPCPTCPGGRAGPGGAYAFPGVREAQEAAAAPPTGRTAGPGIRVGREPAALSALAAGSSDLASRATGLLARIDWPDKPGARVPVAPLTSAEQERFAAGRELYRNACESCHQPDGRGQERVAANLVGSVLALAAPEVTARILINGKEGEIGLMPPLGTMLSDDDVANVLTYIRREWGQTGSPVDPAAVRGVRALTAGRAGPWTNDELLALMPASGATP